MTPTIGRTAPHPFLFRHHVEAQLIAVAVLRPDLAADAARPLTHSELSADCMAVLARIAANPTRAWLHLHACAENAAQAELIEAALDLTLSALTFHSITTLVALGVGRLHEAPDALEVAA